MTTNIKICLRTTFVNLEGFTKLSNRWPRGEGIKILSAARSRHDDDGILPLVNGRAESIKPERSRKQILCVENERDACNAIATVLASYELAWAQSIQDARELHRLQRFSLIFIADHLPDGDGLEFCEEIRDEDYLTPIIIMTRNPELSEIQTRIAGAQRLIKKHQPDYLKELRALADYLSV